MAKRLLLIVALVAMLLGISMVYPQTVGAQDPGGFTAQNPMIEDNAPVTLDANGRTVFNVGETRSFPMEVSCAGDPSAYNHILHDRGDTVYSEKSGTVILLRTGQEITSPHGSLSCYERDVIDLACQSVPTYYEGTNDVAIPGDACGGEPGCTDVRVLLIEGGYVYEYRGPGQTKPFEDFNAPQHWGTLLACSVPQQPTATPAPTMTATVTTTPGATGTPGPTRTPAPTPTPCAKTAGACVPATAGIAGSVDGTPTTLGAVALLLIAGAILLRRR